MGKTRVITISFPYWKNPAQNRDSSLLLVGGVCCFSTSDPSRPTLPIGFQETGLLFGSIGLRLEKIRNPESGKPIIILGTTNGMMKDGKCLTFSNSAKQTESRS
jgi:hypothetical protein